MATTLSINVNKIATLRNARGGNIPDVIQVAMDCERYGAQGITVHPRPDERHIRRDDVVALKKVLKTELNIEGFPDDRYLTLVQEVKPDQATLVPDPPDVITSNTGWNTIDQQDFLRTQIQYLKAQGARVSVFVDPSSEMVRGAAQAGADRVELFTGSYAEHFHHHPEKAVEPYKKAFQEALTQGLGVNAGHDLNLHNLSFLSASLPGLSEVSIGHALICDALYFGLQNTIQLYLRKLQMQKE